MLTEDPNGDNALGANDHTHKAVGYVAAYATPYASRTVRTWLSQPIDHPARAARVPSWLRQFLNPSDTSLQTTQARAFELLILPLAHTRETLNQPVTAAASSEEHAQDRTNSVLVADHIIERVYFASGATEEEKRHQSTWPTQKQLRRFAQLALLLLDGYADIHHAAVTHHIIQIIDYLSDAQPKRALLVAARAATIGNSY